MGRPQRRGASSVKYVYDSSGSESSHSQNPSSDAPQAASQEDNDADSISVGEHPRASGSDSEPSKASETDKDSIIDMVLEDSEEEDNVDNKQRTLRDFVVKRKSKEQHEGIQQPTGRTSERTRGLKRKNYREKGSDSDSMIIKDTGHIGQATPWKSKSSRHTRKVPRHSSMSTSESSSQCSSESDCPTDDDAIELNRSGRPKRKAAQNKVQPRGIKQHALKSQSLYRNLVSVCSTHARSRNSSDENKSVPLDNFKYKGPLRRSERTKQALKPPDKHCKAPKRRLKRMDISSSDDEGDVDSACEDKVEDQVSQQDVYMISSSSEGTDQSEDSEEEVTVTCDVDGDDIHKILVLRKGEEGQEALVKLKGKSYRKTQWVPLQLITDTRRSLLSGFISKGGSHFTLEDAIHEDWLKVHRVIGRKCTNRGCYKYFVKWKGLPYSESTWEMQEDLKDDQEHIARYLKYSKPPKCNAKCRALTNTIPEFENGRELRDYQKESVEWMIHNQQRGINCILGDEMGLGKTAQSTAVLEYQRQLRGVRGPFLVVAPLTTLTHWQREIETWTDMYTVTFSGSKEERDLIEHHEFYFSGATKKSSRSYKFNVLITSYDLLSRATNTLKPIHWKTVIIDEAHKLKGIHSQMREIVADLTVDWLLLMTGTPIQNNLTELFSLMNLLNPMRYPSLEMFREQFAGDPPTVEQVQCLQDALRPILLRRMKEDVETLPNKEEILLKCPLTPEQRTFYKAVYSNNIQHLLGASNGKSPQLANLCMELRKVCNHPFLCKGVEEEVVARHLEVNNSAPDELELLIQSCGKLYVLDQLLGKLKLEGHQVLIFSQFVIMLDVIEDYLRLKGYGYERIDGGTSLRDRELAIDRFSRENKENFVFMLSTKAGGSGITLTAADTVIIYDSDWNPQNDLQAMARCHRIGQDQEVMVYRMITWDTYEQSLFECASRKYGLEEAILGKCDPADPLANNQRILELLRNGAHTLASEENGKAFVAENIDEILKNRSEKRQIGSRAGNSFSEVTFTVQSSENRAYWENLLPDAANDAHNKALSPMGKRRNKKRVNYSEGKKGKFSGAYDTDDSEEFVPGPENVDSPSTDDDDDDNDNDGGNAADLHAKRAAHQKAKWTYQLLTIVLEGYCAFGSQRWREILKYRKDPGLVDKPEHEVVEALHCIQEIIAKAASFSAKSTVDQSPFSGTDFTENDTTSLRDNYECQLKSIYLEVGIPNYLEHAFGQKPLMKTLYTKAKQIQENVKGIEAVAVYIEANRMANLSEEVPIPFHRNLMHSNSKFTLHHDKAILRGIYKHGFCPYNGSKYATAILEDEELGLIVHDQQSAPHDDTPINTTVAGVDLGDITMNENPVLASETSKKQTWTGQEISAAKHPLSRRIKKLLEAFVEPSSNTLVSKMNKLNVKHKPEEAKKVITGLVKSPSKLLQMLNKDVSKSGKRSVENQVQTPNNRIFPAKQCVPWEDKTSNAFPSSSSDIEILSGSEDHQPKTETAKSSGAKELFLSAADIFSPSKRNPVPKPSTQLLRKIGSGSTEEALRPKSPAGVSAGGSDKKTQLGKKLNQFVLCTSDRKDQSKLTEFWKRKSLGSKPGKIKLGEEVHDCEERAAKDHLDNY